LIVKGIVNSIIFLTCAFLAVFPVSCSIGGDLDTWRKMAREENPSAVKYNINEGTGTTPAAQTVNAGKSITLSGGSGFSRAGFSFAGWNTNSSGTGTTYTAGSIYSPNGNITFYAKWIETDVSSNGIEMVRIYSGTFTMGSSDYKDWGAQPPHQVTISKGFYMGKYEVTQEQYKTVMGVNPSYFYDDPASGESRRPVEEVTWYDAVEFCNKLSAAEGLTSAYMITQRTPEIGYPITSAIVTINWSASGYRLPTEAEWEYACRAGTTTAYNTGKEINENASWYAANSGSFTHVVGLKTPNAWGLHDMHGNVREWCWDRYGSYSSAAQTDPTGSEYNINRMIRGGGWIYDDQYHRSAYRDNLLPHLTNHITGFRLVRP